MSLKKKDISSTLGTKGKGLSQFYRDMGIEEAEETGRFERELSRAEKLRKKQDEKMGLARLIGKAAYVFGPVPGFALENALPLYVDWRDKKAEKAFVSTDTGKFGVSKREDLVEVNKLLEEADEAQNWRNVTDIGTSALSAFTLGGGSFKEPTAFRPFQYGGSKTLKTHGPGIFGRGEVGKSLADIWFNNV